MIIKNQSFQEYLQVKGLSQSALKNILKTPAYFKACMDGRVRKESDSLDFGKLAHSAIFFPDSWESKVSVYDGIKRGKAWDAFKQALNGNIAIKPDELEKLKEFISVYQSNSFLRQFFDGGEFEMTVTGSILDVAVKGQIDCYQKNGMVVDLKTTRDASLNEFSKSIFNYGYHIQAAMYLELCEQNNLDAHTFVFVAIESEYPFQAATYELRAEDIALGHSELLRAIRTYKECKQKNEWPSYPQRLIEIGIPSWGI